MNSYEKLAKDNQTILQGNKIAVLCSYRNTKCID